MRFHGPATFFALFGLPLVATFGWFIVREVRNARLNRHDGRPIDDQVMTIIWLTIALLPMLAMTVLSLLFAFA